MQSENKTYSAADIARYHAGQMPAHEMHALEKAALDDPFLADALEGYQFTATPAADLQSIRERLFEKQGENKRRTVWMVPQWLKVAAILLVLAGGTWLALSGLQQDNDSLAIQEKPEELTRFNKNKPDSVATKTDPAPENNQVFSTTNEGNDPVEAAPAKPARNAVAARKTKTRSLPEARQPAAIAMSPTANVPASTQPVLNSDSLLMNRMAQNDRIYTDKTNAIVRGNENRNADLRNRSMPMLENNNQVRNQDGYYRNPPDTAAVIAMGTERKSLADSSQQINIVMQPTKDEAAEVVVLGNSQKAKEGMMRRVVVDSLEPAVGWASFDDYIASNIKEPEDIRYKKLPGGEVELSFDVNRKGEPVNIAVVKSLCTKCDEEAIRLLREGPKWKRNRNGKGRLTIRF